MEPIISDETLIKEALRGFEQHLRDLQMTENTIKDRMRGAREFACFLVGKPHSFREQIKDRI